MKPGLSFLIALATSAFVSHCAADSFASNPGFVAHFQAYPPSNRAANAAEQALLTRYKPWVWIAHEQRPPIDFYKDYIANGTLYKNNKPISDDVSRDLLNQHSSAPGACFNFTGDIGKLSAQQQIHPTIYGRVQHDTLTYQEQTYPFTFLTYNLVFATSGIIKGIPWYNRLLVNMVQGKDDWHQLDHYVAAHIALYNDEPVAVMLQQHNYQTTYIIGKDLTWPADNRIAIDVAQQSNEVYLHQLGEQQHRALSFISADSLEFLINGKNAPFMSGYDITNAQQALDLPLSYLAGTDAFYQFVGKLGASRLLPGRSGPPGADYVTYPGLMPMAKRLVSNYRSSDAAYEVEKFKKLHPNGNFSVNLAGLDAYSHDFLNALNLLEKQP